MSKFDRAGFDICPSSCVTWPWIWRETSG